MPSNYCKSSDIKIHNKHALQYSKSLADTCMVPQEMCCNSQHTYAHAQLLLQELGQQPQGARFKRLSQDMEVYAAEKLGHPIAWKMHQ